ncbi:MAG: hypothetical protein PHT58_07480 [Eubacteriales bacterium]|nr:hypothetical protein [Eubacteriales bacterium]
METQPRYKSVLFWIGLASAVYEAVVASLVTGGATLSPVVGAIGVGLATVLVYCNGNNPCLKSY